MKSPAGTHVNEKRIFLTSIRDIAGRGAKSIDSEVVDQAFVDVLQLVMDGVVFRKNTFEAVPVTVVDDPAEFICELGSFGLQGTADKKKNGFAFPAKQGC